MRRRLTTRSSSLAFATLLTLTLGLPEVVRAEDTKIRRVLVISVDGMHALDMALWVKQNPRSTLGKLAAQGRMFTNASTTRPSDSIPATVGIFTGGSPAVGGMYYDDAYHRAWFPPASNCQGPPGTAIDLKQGINLAADGSAGVDPSKVPMQLRNGVCVPVLPHNMMRLNTIFEVVKAAHWRTAYSEKRPAYDFLNGPSGTGVDDLYTPEIACFPSTPACNNALATISATQAFDEIRVQSVLREIDGLDHTGTQRVGVPALFGMNFQVVNAAKKDSLPAPAGGYTDDTGTPNADLAGALAYVDGAIGRMVSELAAQGLTATTAVIVTAKHGETSLDPSERSIQSTGAIQATLTAAGYPAGAVAKLTQKSAALLWLTDQTLTAQIAGVLTLQPNETALHISQVLSGESLKLLFPDPLADPAPPDIVVVPYPGTNYEPKNSSVFAEHGGFNENDVHVPLLMVHAASIAAGIVRAPVTTTQIAPTVLALLGLDPNQLQAVQLEGVGLLPGVPVSGLDNGVSPR